MTALTGAMAVVGSAAFLFVYLGIEGAPFVSPMPEPAAFLEEELARSITEAILTPAQVQEAHEQAQVALGEAIRSLTGQEARRAEIMSSLGQAAATAARARRAYLESAFKLPSDWRTEDFVARERAASALVQPELGRLILIATQRLDDDRGRAEASYGRSLVTAILARERLAEEPKASEATMLGAAAAASALAERTMPGRAPEIHREASWGFGSIGDGVLLCLLVLGGGVVLIVAAGTGLLGAKLGTVTLATHCDEHGKDVLVEMLVSDETPYEVTHCSAFNGGPVTCDKQCLQWAGRQAA